MTDDTEELAELQSKVGGLRAQVAELFRWKKEVERELIGLRERVEALERNIREGS